MSFVGGHNLCDFCSEGMARVRWNGRIEDSYRREGLVP